LLFVFKVWMNPALFQTGWFVQSLLTQTPIIHVIRTSCIPFIESSASSALVTTSLLIAGPGIVPPFAGVGSALGFVSLPVLYWPMLAAFLLLYAILTHLAKVGFVRRCGS
jgi:Mg2+-importing ATPase